MSDLKEIKCSKNEPVDPSLLQTFAICFSHLIEGAEEASDFKEMVNVNTAAGELEILGTEYQIQVSFVSNKQEWLNTNSVRFSSTNVLFD